MLNCHLCFTHRTCLHWACKQNHTQVVVYLLASGADKEILTNEGDLAAYLTSETGIKRMLGGILDVLNQSF